MKYLRDNKFSNIIISILAIGVMSFGVLSIIAMDSNMNMGMPSACPIISQDAVSGSHNSQDCFNYHLGLMHNLSAATHNSFGLNLVLLLLVCSTAILAVILFEALAYYYTRQKVRQRQLYEKTVTVFARQLGNWLSLFEKRDPAYAFVIA